MSDTERTPSLDGHPNGAGDGVGREMARREPSSIEAGGAVLDAELVSEEEYRAVQRRKALQRYQGYRHDVVVAASWTRKAVTHDRTKTTAKFVARNSIYVLQGLRVLVGRVWEAKTNSRYERQMRSAEAAGQQELLQEWETRAEQARQRRHDRRMDWLQAPWDLAKAIGIFGLTVVGVLLVLGLLLFAATDDPARILGPITAVLDLIQWTAWALAIAWGPFVLLAPYVGVGVLWHIGRTKAPTPAWARPAVSRDMSSEAVTPSIVVQALRNLGIAELRKEIDQRLRNNADAGAGMLSPIALAGCGVEVDVLLPSGVNTKVVQGKRRQLAENLNRHEHELFITIPPAPRTVRLWIADSGALDEPIGPSPLVTDVEMTADYYTGRAPWGQDLRGERVALSLMMRHLLITGLSNQGKTAALRALVLWLALDPTCEFRIADLKGVGDWRMFDGIAATLIQGPTDEHAAEATEMLEAGVEEMQRRIAALEASGATDGVTRKMARSGTGFHPLFLIVDEAQVAFMNPLKDSQGVPYGGTKANSRYFMAARKLHNQGRAVNVLLWQGTQDPTDQNLPKLVREGAHIRASLVVGTESQARMSVGDKAVDGGAAPHLLRQGLDKGTLVVAGDGVELPPGQAAITVRTHFVNGQDATDVAERAKTIRRPLALTPAADPTTERDPLADIARVLSGHTRLRTQEVLNLLAELDRPTYGGWTFTDLRNALPDSAKPYKTKGVFKVSHNRVLEAIAERDEIGDSDTDEHKGGD